MLTDISAYQFQQLGPVIWTVMRKSQRVIHAIIEIRNIRAINHNATGYSCTWRPIEKGERI